MAIGTGLAIAGLAAAGATAYAASQQPDAPDAPNFAAANAEGIRTNAKLLPYMKQVDAAAKMGTKIKVRDPITGEEDELDFTGLGEGDTQAVYADKMAAVALDLQKKYGDQFIEQAREQLKASDPQGWAAREQLYEEVMGALGKPVDSPVADSLEAQILAELQAGADVDKDVMTEVDQYLIGQQMERGGSYGKADEFERAMNMGSVAENRRSARQQKGAAFLAGGFGKGERDYRKSQQDMANLAAFMSGQTPTAQFQQLSGAQNAAAPFIAGTPGPTLNPNAGAQGAQFAQNQYGQQLANPQSNPWMQGLGMGLQTIGTVATIGGQQGLGWWGGAKQPTGGMMGGWAGAGGRGQV